MECSCYNVKLLDLWKLNELYDCAFLTAYSSKYNTEDNELRLYSMTEKLKLHWYNIFVLSTDYNNTKIKALFVANDSVKELIQRINKADRKKEQVKKDAFMLELNDERQKFFEIVKNMGREFEQENVLLIPNKSINNESKTKIVKLSDNSVLHELENINYETPLYLIIDNNNILFNNIDYRVSKPANGMGYLWSHIIADKHWSKLKENQNTDSIKN